MLTQGRYELKDILEDVPGVVGGAATSTTSTRAGGTDNPASGLTIRGVQSNGGAGGTLPLRIDIITYPLFSRVICNQGNSREDERPHREDRPHQEEDRPHQEEDRPRPQEQFPLFPRP